MSTVDTINKTSKERLEMTKKCDCKKCIHCKQIITCTSVYRVNCKKYGDDRYKPTYCDKYMTKKEFVLQEIK